MWMITFFLCPLRSGNRPLVGIIVICDDKQYCVPLSSPKEKHKTMKNDVDFTKIYHDGKLIGVLNFNEMIPVRKDVITEMNIHIKRTDTPEEVHYKELVANQLAFCRINQDAIVRKANRLYEKVTTGNVSAMLLRRCCDFKKLEQVLERYNRWD